MSIFELQNLMQSTRQFVMCSGIRQSNSSADITTSETTRGLTPRLTASRVDVSWRLLVFCLLMGFRKDISKGHQHEQLRSSPGSTSITTYSPFTAIPVSTQATSTRIMVRAFRSRYNWHARDSTSTTLMVALRKTSG